MLVILKPISYSFSERVRGKKVVAVKSSITSGVEVRVAELNRVGAELNLSEDLLYGWNASETLYFSEDDFEEVEPQFINCTDNSTSRENWQGYYERKGKV